VTGPGTQSCGPPPTRQPQREAVLVPWIRSFKIAEDESPRPQDRLYFGFNYFDNVDASVLRREDASIHALDVYRETFGLEKTFLDGAASIGLRLPLNTLDDESITPGLAGTNTDIGDLSVIFKYAFWQDRGTGDLLSIGLAATFPTGPDAFAGAPAIASLHETTLEPFFGYIFNFDNLFVHGFSSIDIPTDSNDVTMFYNDIGVGYYLLHDRSGDRLLTAVVPTFEVHVNTPLNHEGAFRVNDLAATPDVVDLTLGLTLEFNGRSTLGFGVVAPVTGPRPFDVEAVVQLNWRFGPGASRTPAAAGTFLGN
jgi:hypothetical protein